MGEFPGGIFAATAHLELVFQVIYIFCLQHTSQNSHVEALCAHSNIWRNQKQKKSLGKEKEKNRPKEFRKIIILSEKKSLLKATKALGAFDKLGIR